MPEAALLAPPPVPPIAVPHRHSIIVVKFILGCQVRDRDLKTNLVEDVPDCEHVKQNVPLSKMLYGMKAKVETKRVMCPVCGREIGAKRVTEIWRHNGKPPTRPFPTYLSDFADLNWTKCAPESVVQPDVVLMGRIVLDRTFPTTGLVPQVATRQIDEVKELLKRHELLSEATFGFYFVGWGE